MSDFSLPVYLNSRVSVMAPIGPAVWNVPICLCVCVHVIYGSCWPSSELEALGTNVDGERLDIEGVQRVLNPGLLEGSLSFSNFFLFLSLFLSSHQVFAKLPVRQCFCSRSCMRHFLSGWALVHESPHHEFEKKP